jgi:squalene cyclase
VSYILLGLAAEQHPPDPATDAMARFLKGQQRPEGHWLTLALRPPIEGSVIAATALSIRSLQHYAPAADRAAYRQSIDRGAAWLANATPHDTEDRAFLLLGLMWAGADRAAVQRAARPLLAEQRPDGGWAQLPSLGSDAYATGQALFALIESGAITAADPAFVRGVDFLLKTQLADGSWFVRTRAIPLQPHFEAGFPHGLDQFISAAATNWAALALIHAVKSGS